MDLFIEAFLIDYNAIADQSDTLPMITQSDQITSMFVNHREYFLKKLLEED